MNYETFKSIHQQQKLKEKSFKFESYVSISNKLDNSYELYVCYIITFWLASSLLRLSISSTSFSTLTSGY